MSSTISTYVSKINEQYQTGRATEHSYRGALQDLVSAIIADASISVVNEPKRSACGAPDYIISKGPIPLGFIEAKDVGASDLEGKKKNKEQFDRYKSGLENLIITDYLQFYFYQNGVLYDSCTIASVDDGTISFNEAEFTRFTNLIKDFVSYVGNTIKSPSNLAKLMAGKARMLAEVIRLAIESDEKSSANSTLHDQMRAFKDILIHDITPPAFADIYAQTITYGMFAARLHDDTLEDFSRQEAASLIPKTNPFLRNLFQYISGYDVDPRIVWIVDSLAEIFVHTDIAQLLKNFGRATKTHDPIIHFYETFLAEYDPKLRKARGVWYTPEPVVNFIVRAVDDILKSEFGLKDGLADTSKTTIKVEVPQTNKQAKSDFKKIKQEVHKVQILDPATGTGTFLAEVVKHIHQKFVGMEGIWSNYVENDLLPRLNGFEILMASYAMAHLKLDLLLSETGYVPSNPDRFRIYLTNSLEEAHPDTGTLFANWLSHEASEANAIKRDAPVMCVIGNPPYSVSSSNKGVWIDELMKEYKKGLKEKNIQPLSDDYIKFIRYAHHFVEKNGEGVLAYITNNGYIDGLVHKKMRESLLKSFDKLYVLNLHGNSSKKETALDGSKDENVFDIKQGVAILLLVKNNKNDKVNNTLHTVDLYGKRKGKYEWLQNHSLNNIKWNKFIPSSKEFLFQELDTKKQKKYEKGFPLGDLLIKNSGGVKTHRDNLVIDFNKTELISKIERFYDSSFIDSDVKTQLNLKETVSFKLAEKRLDEYKGSDIRDICYRPFDNKVIYFSNKLIDRSRTNIMRHMFNENIALICARSNKTNRVDHFFITDKLSEMKTGENSNGSYHFPLYLYPPETQSEGMASRTPNLDPKILKQIEKKLGLKFTPEKENTEGTFAPIALLDYIYAVLHSPNYREKYKEFLKIDFPRVPFPTDAEKFWKLVELGGEIRSLHLMESEKLNTPIATYPKVGDNIVTRKLTSKDSWETIDDETGKVWINDEQYFDKVPLKAWEFYIGGYQPAQKWLKDRKDRELQLEDIRYYMKIIVALVETERVMGEIDVVGVE